MQAARLLRKLCMVAALTPLMVHAGDVTISIRAPRLVPAILAAFFPPRPLPVSTHHLSSPSTNKVIRGGIAIDGRTFASGGIHYRLDAQPANEPGSAEERAARARLQALLDGGGVRTRTLYVEPGGFHVIALDEHG